MLSKEEVRHISRLARLGLAEKEIGKYQKELSSILDYVEQLKKVDVSRIEPTSHSVKLENIERQDSENRRREARNEKLMELAPETERGYLKVKSILK